MELSGIYMMENRDILLIALLLYHKELANWVPKGKMHKTDMIITRGNHNITDTELNEVTLPGPSVKRNLSEKLLAASDATSAG